MRRLNQTLRHLTGESQGERCLNNVVSTQDTEKKKEKHVDNPFILTQGLFVNT